MSELIINMNYCIKCQYWLRVSLLTVIVSSIFTEAAAYLEGSIVKCYNEGQEVAIPFMRDDPCYRCKCLSTEIVCVDTCSHKKCHFNGKMYKHNESWTNGTCTRCTCSNGETKCHQLTCQSNIECAPRQVFTTLPGQCCPSCVSLNSQCTVKGSPLMVNSNFQQSSRTISTFDNLTYKFNGKCNYVLTRDCNERSFMIHLVQDPIDSSVPTATSSQRSRDTRPPSLSSSSSSPFVSSSLERVNFTALTPRDNSNAHWSHRMRRSGEFKGETVTHLSPPSLSSSVSLVPFNSSTKRVDEADQSNVRFIRQVSGGLHSSAPSSSSRASSASLSHSPVRASISLVIKIGKTKVRLTPTDGPEGWKIRHGRTETSLPFIQMGVMTIVKKAIPPSSRSRSSTRGNIMVYTAKGIEVTWNGDDHLNILMPSKLKENLCGLCGNYNGNKRDDLTPRKGRSRSISRFIRSWKVGSNGFCPNRQIKRHVPDRVKMSRLPLIDT